MTTPTVATKPTTVIITEQQPDSPARPAIPRVVSPQPVPAGAELEHPALYFNQELSWIDFNWRVVHLALDERTPLLERVRFVAISCLNLDEFTQKRVGGLLRQEAAGVNRLSRDGRTPTEQIALLREAMRHMHATLTSVWETVLRPALQDQLGIAICNYSDLKPNQQTALSRYFREDIYPILTPLTVDPAHPFPFISNLSLSLAITLQHPKLGTVRFARLKIPANQSRFVEIPPESGETLTHFLPIEQLIAYHVYDLFPGMDVISTHPFRITRNADIQRNEEEASDLLAMISGELRERRFASVVRLEVDKGMPLSSRQLLIKELELAPEDVIEVDGLLDLTGCFQLANLNLPDYKYPTWIPVLPYRLQQGRKLEASPDIFSVIRQGDVLVHHPYDSFTGSTQRLIEEAALDDQVLAIKLTLYRTSDESPIVNALIQAAERGKQVAVLVEVQARFDEANNIEWAKMLENSGVHVAYGLVGLKTHTKATLIVRREEGGLRIYCHIGTGNYHPKTARLYTDLGLLTCSPELGHDIVNLFHSLTGYALEQEYKKVLVAPHKMRSTFTHLIEQEIAYQKKAGNGHIMAKMNALDDLKTIKKLYQASQAGVRIDLIIRGHSCLRPGLPGYSDNIRVISILGRFLEHDRIYYFHNNNQPLVYIGSADWRGRNLDERVELIAPIEDVTHKQRLIRTLETALSDNTLAWELDAEGNYRLRYPKEGEQARNFHEMLMESALTHAKRKM